MKKLFKNKKNQKQGLILFGVLILAVIATSLITALTMWFGIAYKNSGTTLASEKAFHFAEAGIEYARWHDFMATNSDSYSQNVTNSEDEIVGSFEISVSVLEIEPVDLEATSTASTTQIIIESKGYTTDYPNIQRTIRLEMINSSSTEGIETEIINWQEIQ